MTPEKYNRVKEIFLAACDKPAGERTVFIEAQSSGDEEIRREVESLLREHQREVQVMPSEPENPLGSSMSAILSHANIDVNEAGEIREGDAVHHGGDVPEGVEILDDSSSSSQSGVVDAGRFMAGTMAAGRYRIIELLGRGGMGEVYRADDTVLNQSVALKFLPALFGSDEKWLTRFRDEVRLARQVTHPNVCRVFDIGEFQGEQFISMEYVDGENLASLLRRIGRLPHAKALQIARQLCAGLAAAHDRGVLHRDLKPANVMIDGRGSVRITDFGLAAPVDQMRKEAIRAGTPAYMSPEQLAGKPITVRSDVYSLGLLLYEMFSGRRAFKGGSLRDYLRLHSSETPTPPSEFVDDIDPIVERVILKCLEKDPKNRPASALAVAAALPGGDPLRAILAAGETPSPEVVAAAGEAHGGLKPRTATAYLMAGLLGILLVVLLAPSAFLMQKALKPEPPLLPASSETAIKMLQKLGYTETAKDRAQGFALDPAYFTYIHDTLKTPDRWKALVPSPVPAGVSEPDPQLRLVYFWYRQSPDWLAPQAPDLGVQENDPPPLRPGMVEVRLDAQGTLIGLQAQPMDPPARPASPSNGNHSPSEPRELDWWEKLLDAANLSEADLKPVPPEKTIPVFADSRFAWDGSVGNGVAADATAIIAGGSVTGFKDLVGGSRYDELTMRVEISGGGTGASAKGTVVNGVVTAIQLINGGTGYTTMPKVTISSGYPVHIEAAEYRGRAVYFSIAGPWKNMKPPVGIDTYVRTILSSCLLVVGVFLAWRSFRSGRADRSGATRMALAFFVFGLIGWLLRGHHVPDVLLEFSQFRTAVGSILYLVCVVWIFYLALEPYVRRVWPETVISWSRMLSGKWFDPLVGRDILIGAAAGTVTMVLQALDMLVPRWLGLPAPMPSLFYSTRMLSSLGNYSTLFSGALSALYVALIFLLLLVVLRMTLRHRIAVAVGFVVLIVAATARISTVGPEDPNASVVMKLLQYFGQLDFTSLIVQSVIATLFLTLLVRQGLVALIFCILVRNLLWDFPITSDLGAWYAGTAFVGIGCAVAVLVTSFYAALGGRSPISIRALES